MCRIGGRTNGDIRKGLSFSNILPDDPLNDMTGEKVFKNLKILKKRARA